MNIDHTKAFFMKLNKEDLVRLLLNYQGKFNFILDDLKITVTNVRLNLLN